MTEEEFRAEWLSGSGVVVAHTSGSTGLPKAIALDKRDMEASARRTLAFFFGEDDAAWRELQLHSCVSPDFIGGKMMAVRAYVARCGVSFETPSNHPLENHSALGKVDLLSVVPSQLLFLLEHRERLARTARILVGGGALPPSLVRSAGESGLDIWESYGMTETCSHIALRKVDGVEGKPFVALPGVKVSETEGGALRIMLGNKMYDTNDLCRLVSAREFHILGRADNVIVSGGRKLHPETLERRMEQTLGRLLGTTIEIALTSRPDPKWGEALVLVFHDSVSVDSPCLSALPPRLKEEFLADGLEHYEIPKGFLRVDALPRTANGKLDRPALRRIVTECRRESFPPVKA